MGTVLPNCHYAAATFAMSAITIPQCEEKYVYQSRNAPRPPAPEPTEFQTPGALLLCPLSGAAAAARARIITDTVRTLDCHTTLPAVSLTHFTTVQCSTQSYIPYTSNTDTYCTY